MSTTLPVVNRQPELIEQLLDAQQQLTAVEQFSRWHSDSETAVEPTSPAQEKYYRSLIPASAPAPGQQFAFEVDLDACSGCKACVVACHTLNGLDEDESWRQVGTLLIGDDQSATPASIQHVTTACHHCEDPGCLNGCPVKAYDKDPVTGIVRHLDDQCIGCKYCTMMCPYEVPQYRDRLGIVRKCDMCHQRLSVGEAPACVQSCPNEAIRITTITKGTVPGPDEVVIASAPRSNITKPTTTYRSSRSTVETVAKPQDENVDEVAESHWPLAVMLVATQLCVGVLIAELVGTTLLVLSGAEVPATVPLANLVAAFLIGNAGLAIAPLHLGQPLRAWRVFLGLRTSWLSREAVVLGKFMGMLGASIALYAMVAYWDSIPTTIQSWIPREWIPDWAGRAVALSSIPVGLAGLYCSAMIYIATRRQLWRRSRTLPRFFGTALAGGPVIAAAIFAGFGFSVVACLLSLTAAAAMAWKWRFERAIVSPQAAHADPYDRRSIRLIESYLKSLQTGRDNCLLIAAALAAVSGVVGCVSPPAGCVGLAIAAVVFVTGENFERLLYFKSVVYDRMPGTL